MGFSCTSPFLSQRHPYGERGEFHVTTVRNMLMLDERFIISVSSGWEGWED